jgi:hypothetical protein
VDGDSLPNDIWWVDTDTSRQFGKPDGYCRKCSSKRTQGAGPLAKYQRELGIVKGYEKSRWEAEDEYKDAWYKAHWKEQIPTLTPEMEKAENDRLEKLYGDLWEG